MTDFVETTLPALIFTLPNVPGDVDALGRLVIDDDQGVDQWWVVYGIEQDRDYAFTDSTGSGALLYQAESRTAMGGSATAVGPSGASGAGSNVMRNTALTTNFQAIVSTQASGGGAHLSHVGEFRVYARVQVPTSNTGTVNVGLEWAEGDYRRFTLNSTTDIGSAWEGSWRLVDLGLVTIPKATAGTQRWEGRILAKSSAVGDDIDVDWLMLVPARGGVVRAVQQYEFVTSFLARDEFQQSAGALTGKVLPVGGTWTVVTGSSANDFQATGTFGATRAAVSDASIQAGRYVTAGTTSYTATLAQINLKTTDAAGQHFGLIVRHDNATGNYLRVRVSPTLTATCVLTVEEWIGSVNTSLGEVPVAVSAGDWLTLRVTVDAAGRVNVWLTQSVPRGTVFQAASANLATGGALASGRVGIWDARLSGTAATRTFANFYVGAPTGDAAVFASQSVEIRHDGVRREDSGGTLWVQPSSYVGDYLTVPPAGAEGRTARVIVKASRNLLGTGPDNGTDDISAQLWVTPRYLT